MKYFPSEILRKYWNNIFPNTKWTDRFPFFFICKKVYGKRPTDDVSWGLRLLGVATIIQCGLRIWQGDGRAESNDELVETRGEYVNKCQLCLEAMPTTTTPCGHLFCWNCLGDWLRTRAQCPFCREHVKPSRIVHLMNLWFKKLN